MSATNCRAGAKPEGENLARLLVRTLPMYELPGQAYWRALELFALRTVLASTAIGRPMLEIGCSDGSFASELFEGIEMGIDVNPRAVARARGRTYQSVQRMDARALSFRDKSFATVFGNSVVEHIPDIERVLKCAFDVLIDDGTLLLTVPLAAMNTHLFLASDRYRSRRQRQLMHVNLLSIEAWEELLRAAGFRRVRFTTYLSGGQCTLWDAMDAPVCVGISSRANVGAVLRMTGRLMPTALRAALYRRVAAVVNRLDGRVGSAENCAAVIVALK